MNFKSWRDYYLFIKNYAVCSCCNCKHTNTDNIDVNDESNTDATYARHFCVYHMAMIRWDLQGFVCPYWESVDGDRIQMDSKVFLLHQDVWDFLEGNENHKWTIEEITRLQNGKEMTEMRDGWK